MRITETEKKHILEAVQNTSNELKLTCIEIALFGSRLNDKEKGGDLDLYIKFQTAKPLETLQVRTKIKIKLHDYLGEQKIDILLDDGFTELGAFGALVKEKKAILWIKP